MFRRGIHNRDLVAVPTGEAQAMSRQIQNPTTVLVSVAGLAVDCKVRLAHIAKQDNLFIVSGGFPIVHTGDEASKGFPIAHLSVTIGVLHLIGRPNGIAVGRVDGHTVCQIGMARNELIRRRHIADVKHRTRAAIGVIPKGDRAAQFNIGVVHIQANQGLRRLSVFCHRLNDAILQNDSVVFGGAPSVSVDVVIDDNCGKRVHLIAIVGAVHPDKCRVFHIELVVVRPDIQRAPTAQPGTFNLDSAADAGKVLCAV